ncbi:MAG: ABC transporter permease [Dehalococcoidia bacterium]
MAQDTQTLQTGVFGVSDSSLSRRASRALRPWLQRPLGLLGAFLILSMLVLALIAPYVAPEDPRDFSGRRLESPSSSHLLGTNNLGQDTFSRTLYGAQISIAVGLTATILGVGSGMVLGVVTGYVGGWADIVIQRFLEIIASFPGLFLALLVVAVLGRPGETGSNVLTIAWQLRSLEIAIGLSFIFGSTRIVRSAVLTQRNMAYIDAAKAIGASSNRILWKHILPNVLPFVIVSFTTILGIVILIEASLSFLGYGVAVGTPSWGVDLSTSNRQYFIRAPWLMVGPGVALSLTVLGFNFMGDALRDILDPRLRGTR